jgi:thymidylate synthase (FAD)
MLLQDAYNKGGNQKMILIKPSFEILDNPIDPVRCIAQYASTCYKSENVNYAKLVKDCLAKGHESVLEHEKVTVHIICDRGVSHELVRHRLASFSQESTRYCNYSKDKFGNQVTFVIPPWVDIVPGEYLPHLSTWTHAMKMKEADFMWFRVMHYTEEKYLWLIANYWQPQQARAVLPNSLKTEIVITANLREWRHIFKLRAAGEAGKPHPQMLEIMIPMLREFKRLIPIIFDDIKEMEV